MMPCVATSSVWPSGAARATGPTLGSMAGHVMASVFHDTLQADVEQTQRVTQTINSLPAEAADAPDALAVRLKRAARSAACSRTAWRRRP